MAIHLPGVPRKAAGADWRQSAKIDDRTRQNSAYRPSGHKKRPQKGVVFLFVCKFVCINGFSENHKTLIKKFGYEIQQHIDGGYKIFIPPEPCKKML